MDEKCEQLKFILSSWALMIILIILLLFCGSCNTTSQMQTNITMEYSIDTVGVSKQFIDSVCIADTLGAYPSEWTYSPMRGYESKKDISTYGWLKSSNLTFYRIIKYEDGTYRLTKRTVDK